MKRFFVALLVAYIGATFPMQGQVFDSLPCQRESSSADSLVHFQFVPGVNMFYAQYKENKKNLKRLTAFLRQNLDSLQAGQATVQVEGFCASASSKKANRALAKIRSNRVKSYFIEHAGLVESNFRTINTDSACLQGKNVVRLTYLLAGKVALPTASTAPPGDKVSPGDQAPPGENVAPPLEEASQTSPVATPLPSEVSSQPEVSSPEDASYAAGSPRVLFALKTNLLYNLALTPNIEVEIPIGQRWSIHAEYQYGWWLRKDNTFCWQIEAGGLEGRYWLGRRQGRPVLSGWFIGLFAGGGMYDFQLEKDAGYQGEFYIMLGASAGYVKPIARNLHLEFSTGVGALVTNYRRYHVVNDELIKQGLSMKYKAFLPIKAKVSLVWLINGKKKKGAAL